MSGTLQALVPEPVSRMQLLAVIARDGELEDLVEQAMTWHDCDQRFASGAS